MHYLLPNKLFADLRLNIAEGLKKSFSKKYFKVNQIFTSGVTLMKLALWQNIPPSFYISHKTLHQFGCLIA